MHTYDGSDLLKLDGKIRSENGEYLTICKPTVLPTASDEGGPDSDDDGAPSLLSLME